MKAHLVISAHHLPDGILYHSKQLHIYCVRTCIAGIKSHVKMTLRIFQIGKVYNSNKSLSLCVIGLVLMLDII